MSLYKAIGLEQNGTEWPTESAQRHSALKKREVK